VAAHFTFIEVYTVVPNTDPPYIMKRGKGELRGGRGLYRALRRRQVRARALPDEAEAKPEGADRRTEIINRIGRLTPVGAAASCTAQPPPNKVRVWRPTLGNKP
jgi:hypothetical protein